MLQVFYSLAPLFIPKIILNSKTFSLFLNILLLFFAG
jgi:hypothetical protein